jgi:alkaline phosphatase
VNRALPLVLVVAGCAGATPIGGADDAGPDAIGDAVHPDAPPAGPAPAVIVLVGDGMGTGQLDAASLFAHGATGLLAMQALPASGEVRTGGPSGITDSAAAATVMATGVYTHNGRIGVDRAGRPVETLIERAAARGWATGVVTTTAIPHATPAAFTAHVDSRADLAAIARQQAAGVADVVLGGGAQYFTALGGELAASGYVVVATAAELAAAAPTASRLFGAFAADHLTYVADRPADSTEPTLAEMAVTALGVLDRDPDGVFLMIEGGRIDHAGHANDLVHSIHETLAFDDAIDAVVAWARARGNTTVLVTADHECGGLAIAAPAPAGEYPDVTWRWLAHTNARVPIYGDGPGADAVAGAIVDHRWVYAIARARIDGAAVEPPAREPIPDGELGDLRHRAAVQAVASGFGEGFNQLDALWLDATEHGLMIGVEGVFEWGENAVELWIDADPGAATGPAGLAGAITDRDGAADAVLAASRVTAPGVPGFGVDVVVVSIGGADPHVEDRQADGGARGVRAPHGSPADLGWLGAAINFGAVRTRAEALAAAPGQGMEAFVPWATLYPAGRPAGARVAVAAVLVNSDGGFTSNQALPPFGADTANPGRALTALPGVVIYDVDADGDGVIDGDVAPVIIQASGRSAP